MTPALALIATLVSTATPARTSPPAEEFATIDALIKAVYGVISGPAGQKRDWPRMRSLFTPDARMIAIGKTRATATKPSEIRRTVLTVEDYIRTSGPFLEERGFFEREVARRTEEYGAIAHVFSTYESRQKTDDPKPFARGINSFGFYNDGHRWWVQSLIWQGEDPTTPVSEKYLKSG